MLAVKFWDLQHKQFISRCSTSVEGDPRRTKHHGNITRTVVAVDYLSYAAGIDIHNHYRMGAGGFEDAWQTNSAHIRQFAGVFSFIFTNAFLAMKHFKKGNNFKHSDLKIALANEMVNDGSSAPRRCGNFSWHSSCIWGTYSSCPLRIGSKWQS